MCQRSFSSDSHNDFLPKLPGRDAKRLTSRSTGEQNASRPSTAQPARWCSRHFGRGPPEPSDSALADHCNFSSVPGSSGHVYLAMPVCPPCSTWNLRAAILTITATLQPRAGGKSSKREERRINGSSLPLAAVVGGNSSSTAPGPGGRPPPHSGRRNQGAGLTGWPSRNIP